MWPPSSACSRSITLFYRHAALARGGRAEFERLCALPPDRLTDLQRAARFLYLQRLAFGGKVSGRNFGVDARARASISRSLSRCWLIFTSGWRAW
jgi:hypothetical protein